jgi:hypothetical protein
MGSSMSFMRVTVRRKHRAAYVRVSRRACTCTCRSSCICAFFVFSKHKCSRMHACVRNACARCTQPSIRTHERAKLLEVDGVRIIRVAFFHHLLQIVLVGLLSERLKDSSQLVFANRPVAILRGNIAMSLVSGAVTRRLCLSVIRPT